jgi:hypothetical protein
MLEYIERGKALKEWPLCDEPADAYQYIKNIPAADVRPVVMCRDCIYAPTGNKDGADLEWPCDDFPERNPCPLKCEDRWYSRKPAPDFFCANGKKLNT